MVSKNKKFNEKNILIVGSIILFILVIFYGIIPLSQTTIEEQFPDSNAFAPVELYPVQNPSCSTQSSIMYVTDLTPRTSKCNSQESSNCVSVDFFGYMATARGIERDNQLLAVVDDNNPIYEDANVKIETQGSGGAFGFRSYAKNYFNMISNFSCDVSEIFEDADNVIECSFLSSRSQLINVLAFSGRQGTDKITDLRDLSRSFTIQQGLNTINFNIDQQLIEDENYYLMVTFLDPKKWESDSGICVFYQQMQSMKMQKIPFSIIPKPTYFNKQPSQQCPIGYMESSTANTLCIRDDLNELPCYRLPAPITVNYTYSCTASGQWSQVLYTPQNCPLNPCAVGYTCEVTSGTCIIDQIYDDVFKQCSTGNDCPNICSNVGSSDVSCVNSSCKYSSVCTVQPEKLVQILKQSGLYPEEYEPINKSYYVLAGGLAVGLFFLIRRFTRKK